MKRLLSLIFVFSVFLVSRGVCQTLADYQFSTGHDASKWKTLDSTRNLLILGSTRYYVRSNIEEIGFDFPFADTSYSQFSVNHDGNLRLGGTLTGTTPQAQPFHSTRAGQNNPKINYFGCAGYTSDSVYVRKQTFGTAPQRVTVVEFALSTYITSSRNSLQRYQVQLFENGDIEVVYPSVAPPITPACNRQQGMCIDASDIWFVDYDHSATHLTAGCSTLISSGYWPDTNRYYKFAFPDNVCVSPSNLVATAATTGSVSLRWRNTATVASFAVEYSTSPITPGTGAGMSATVNDTVATVAGLLPGTTYYFYVRSICDAGDTSNAAFLVVQTPEHEPVDAFPYYCDFEDSTERAAWWTLRGNLSTYWWIDTAVNNTDLGLYALYVSQDSGLTNTGGDQWIGAFAYREMNMEAGDYAVSFDWRAAGDWRNNGDGSRTYYHFLRALLVPASTTLTSRTPPLFPVSPHYSALQPDWIDLVPETHSLAGATVWTQHSAVVTVPQSGCYRLVFYWETDGYDPPTDLPGAVDNIEVDMLACPQPQNLTAVCTDDEIALSWQRGGNETLWMVHCGMQESFTTDTFYLASGLAFNTLYDFDVFSVCGEGDTSIATSASFRTTAGEPVTAYPYYCDFEDTLLSRSWVTLGEGQANQWYVGPAANNTPGGAKALYVSCDGGATNSYSGATASHSYAYRLFVLDNLNYVFRFDWRCWGDADYHFMRAFLVPQNDIPQAGTFPANNNLHIVVPNGWTDLNPDNHYMSGDSNWTTLTRTVNIADSGVYALLLMWENDAFAPGNPPAAVDNVQIEVENCPMPQGLSADAGLTMVDLTWEAGMEQAWLVTYSTEAMPVPQSVMVYNNSYTVQGLAPNTEYLFEVRSLCMTGDTSIAASLTLRTQCLPVPSLPFYDDFENYASGTGSNDEFIPCWNRVGNYGSASPKVTDSWTPGNKCLYWTLTAGLLDDVYVALPQFDESIELTYTVLSFSAMKLDFIGAQENPVFVVGVMSDPEVPSTFSPVDTVTVTNDSVFEHFSVSLLPYVGSDQYVAIRSYIVGSNFASVYCLMDDIELVEVPYCRKPTSATGIAGTDTIALSWISGGNETLWTVNYSDTAVVTSVPRFVARVLEPNTEYLFAIRTICGEGDTSQSLQYRCRTLQNPSDPEPECDAPVFDSENYDADCDWDGYASVIVRWTGNADAYQLHYEGPYIDTTVVVADTAYEITGLPCGGYNYELALRSICNDSLFSEWAYASIGTPIINIDNPSLSYRVTLFPNPSGGDLVVALDGIDQTATVTVVDLQGRVVRHLENVSDFASFTNLTPGSYFVRVHAPSINIVRKLVVR